MTQMTMDKSTFEKLHWHLGQLSKKKDNVVWEIKMAQYMLLITCALKTNATHDVTIMMCFLILPRLEQHLWVMIRIFPWNALVTITHPGETDRQCYLMVPAKENTQIYLNIVTVCWILHNRPYIDNMRTVEEQYAALIRYQLKYHWVDKHLIQMITQMVYNRIT